MTVETRHQTSGKVVISARTRGLLQKAAPFSTQLSSVGTMVKVVNGKVQCRLCSKYPSCRWWPVCVAARGESKVGLNVVRQTRRHRCRTNHYEHPNIGSNSRDLARQIADSVTRIDLRFLAMSAPLHHIIIIYSKNMQCSLKLAKAIFMASRKNS